MQLHFSIANQQFVALLDCGSSHNFIHPVVARQVGLAFYSSAGAHVTMANGGRVACHGLVRDVAIRLGAEPFAIHCYSVPLDSYDMVLGAAFLRTLGPILWDCDDPCIAFWRGGRRVLCRGLRSPRSDVPVPGHLHTVRSTAPAIRDGLDLVGVARSRRAADGSNSSVPPGTSLTISARTSVVTARTPSTSGPNMTCLPLKVVSCQASWMASSATTSVCVPLSL
jgi:hypothetical protein